MNNELECEAMSSAAEKPDLRRARGEDTRLHILDAARDALAESGAAGTTTRAIADRAGVQLSLVHYHFRGKQQLLAAVLDRENERLLERQRALFAGPGTLADKWRAACAYLREDLGSGYVRILWELWSAGLTDPELAARWREAVAGWRELLTRVAAEWTAEHRVGLPISPLALATLVGDAFLGAEAEILAGFGEDEAPHYEALESIAGLIEWVERSRDGAR
jgi:AcrR family transcriptional regulator